MMLNKYGHFKYLDFAFGAKENANYSTNVNLQQGASLDQLRSGVEPYLYAGLENNDYITEIPKKLYKSGELGFLSANVSDESGNFTPSIQLTAQFSSFFSMTGFTIQSKNIIEDLEIIAYRNEEIVAQQSFSANEYNMFYPLTVDTANKVVFNIKKIAEPHHFLGIFNIDFGKQRTFDDRTNVCAETDTYFSVLGNTLEYDTLNLDILKGEDESYLLQRKQPIEYIVGKGTKNRFYVETGTDKHNGTYDIEAYDCIGNLEGDFLGGMYENKPLAELIAEILSGVEIKFDVSNLSGVKISGYLPITSRRKALQTVLLSSNVRCYKGENLVFKPFELTLSDVVLNESNIIGNPEIEKKQSISIVDVAKRNYTKSQSVEECYHWYIAQNVNTEIRFSKPHHDLKAYEVIGTDENGNDIVSETESQNVTFVKRSENYCIVNCKTANKVVIKGKTFDESLQHFKTENQFVSQNGVYQQINIEIPCASDAQAVSDLLYTLSSRRLKIKFKTLEPLEIGGYYSILGEKLNIAHIHQELNGIYEVEAE